MMALRTICVALGAFIALALASGAAHAANPHDNPLCGSDVTVTSGPVAGTYDPFAPNPVTFPTVTLTFTRAVAATGGGKTQDIAFYMVQPAGSPSGNQVIWPDTGQNILFTDGGPHPTFAAQPQQPQPAGIAYLWGTASAPDTQMKTVQVQLDPGLDLEASAEITFDMVYICRGTGGYQDVFTPTTLPGVIHVSITVLSGLQVSYAGPALDFGDISDLTSGGLVRSGFFHIRSSGAYTVELSSGNHFLMTYPGGPSTSPDPGTVGYSLSFIGETLSYGDETFPMQTCHRAGVSAVQYIPIGATLGEGGVGKTPSPSYSDTLTVTFSPIIDPGTSQPFCSTP